ncbi:hypothetical protein [Mesorhizobium sp. A556]
MAKKRREITNSDRAFVKRDWTTAQYLSSAGFGAGLQLAGESATLG